MRPRIYISPKSDEGLYFYNQMNVAGVVSMEASAALKLHPDWDANFHDVVETDQHRRVGYSYQDTLPLIERALNKSLKKFGIAAPVEIIPYINLRPLSSREGASQVLAPDAKLVCKLVRKHIAPTLFSQCQTAGFFIPEITTEDALALVSKGRSVVATSDRSSAGSGVFQCFSSDHVERIQHAPDSFRFKFAPFLNASSWNMHVVVAPDITIVAPPSRQLIFGRRSNWGDALRYEGNVFVPDNCHEANDIACLQQIGFTAADDLRTLGYLGICGLDVLIESDTGRGFIVDINPRLQASTFGLCVLQSTLGLRPVVVDHCDALSRRGIAGAPDTRVLARRAQTNSEYRCLWNFVIRNETGHPRIVSQVPARRSPAENLEVISSSNTSVQDFIRAAIEKALFLGFPNAATTVEPGAVISRMLVWTTNRVFVQYEASMLCKLVRDHVLEEFTCAI